MHNKELRWTDQDMRDAKSTKAPPAPVLLFESKIITDRGNMLEYYLKPLSQSIQRNKVNQTG